MKRVIGAAVLFVGAAVLAAEAAYWLGHVAGQAPSEGAGSCAVLVLGYPAARDGAPHPVQRLRVEAALAAHRESRCARLVLSGGAAKNAHVEAESMAAIARALGAREEELVVEARARTTWENIGCSAPYLEGYDRVFLVSDSLHVHRAKRYACRQQPSLCSRIHAVGAHPPLALLWWKVPAAAYELRAWVRDLALYERGGAADAAPCPAPDGTSPQPAGTAEPTARLACPSFEELGRRLDEKIAAIEVLAPGVPLAEFTRRYATPMWDSWDEVGSELENEFAVFAEQGNASASEGLTCRFDRNERLLACKRDHERDVDRWITKEHYDMLAVGETRLEVERRLCPTGRVEKAPDDPRRVVLEYVIGLRLGAHGSQTVTLVFDDDRLSSKGMSPY